jgi:hypothetical protein
MVAALAAAAPASAADRYALANGCWTLTSPGGAIGKDGGGYRAGGGTAEAFYLKATRLGGYMLFGRDGDFLAADGDTVVNAAAPGAESDWTVDVRDGLYTIVNDTLDRSLVVRDGRLATGPEADATGFGFEAAQGCKEFPEIETSTEGEPRARLAFGESRGFMDLHLHLMAFEFLGGRAHCGRPWHPYGVTVAMTDCPDHYIADGNTAVLENVLSDGSPAGSHDPTGWPAFTDWPRHDSLTHEQTYYKWVERAWRGGLRMMTVLLVDNAVLCEVYPYKQNPCNEMNTVRLEARRLREFEDYIDAQSGGPGKGWFRIVTDPYQARRVMNRGKLAVIPGIEVSKLFDCGEFNDAPECTREQIDAQLDEVHKLGVRQMELVNKFDNALTGVAGDSGATGQITNAGNLIETGHFWAMQTCEGDGHAHDREQVYALGGVDRDPLVGNILRTFLPPDLSSVTYPSPPHCNQRGLTPLGAYLLRRMVEKKMIFDPDHMSVIARDQAMTVMESYDYPGVVSSHSWSDPTTLPRIYELGGTISPHEKSAKSFVEAWQEHEKVSDERFYFGVGYGTDQNGFASQAGPRAGNEANPVTYPFTSFDGTVTLHKQRSGEREYDINVDGVAHYGLYPDFIQDARTLGGDAFMRDMVRGPESYLQMWERVEGISGERCRPRGGRFRRGGLKHVRLGVKPMAMLRAAGQPVSRHRRWRWCVKGVPGAKVTAGFTRAGRSTIVASTAPSHQAKGARVGDRAKRLRGRAQRAGKGLFVRRAGRRAFVYGVREQRIDFVAVTSRRIASRDASLRSALRLAGVR